MDPSRLREISILVDSLDMQRADKLLEKLPPNLQQQVRDAVVQLDGVDEEERKQIIDRFLGRNSSETPSANSPGVGAPVQHGASNGVYSKPRIPLNQNSQESNSISSASKRSSLPPELAEKLGIKPKPSSPNHNAALNALEKARQSPASAGRFQQQPAESRIPEPVTTSDHQTETQPSPEPQGTRTSTFDLVDEIAEADLDTLAELLVRESSQYVAVVMSLLPADKNVQLLELFSSSAQNEILRRLETLQHIDEEILDDISRQLHSVIQRRNKLKTRQASGRVAIAKILSAAQRVKSGTIVQRIENQLETVETVSDPDQGKFLEAKQLQGTTVPQSLGHQTNDISTSGGYQFSMAGSPVGAISADRPVDMKTPPPSRSDGPLSIGSTANQLQASSQENRFDLEQDLQKRIDQARDQMGRRASNDEFEEPSPAEQLLNSERKVAASEPSVNASTAKSSRNSRDLEQSLLSDEVDSVQGFADQEVKISFEKLQKCDRNSLQALLATAKPKLTLLALRGAPAGLTKKVLKMLPKGEAKEVEFRIQNMGPTRLVDIQQAQDYLLRLATLLEKLGRFRFPRGFFG